MIQGVIADELGPCYRIATALHAAPSPQLSFPEHGYCRPPPSQRRRFIGRRRVSRCVFFICVSGMVGIGAVFQPRNDPGSPSLLCDYGLFQHYVGGPGFEVAR